MATITDIVTYVESLDNKHLSRYFGLRNLLNTDGILIQETWFSDTVEQRDDDIIYEVPPEFDHRPDLVAEDCWGTPDLYWLVGLAGTMIDCYAETYNGLKLRLPSVNYVYEYLQNRRKPV